MGLVLCGVVSVLFLCGAVSVNSIADASSSCTPSSLSCREHFVPCSALVRPTRWGNIRSVISVTFLSSVEHGSHAYTARTFSLIALVPAISRASRCSISPKTSPIFSKQHKNKLCWRCLWARRDSRASTLL